MAYDPKKKRPKRENLDAVVDEIFGEEPETKNTAVKKPAEKKSTVKKPVEKKVVTKKDSKVSPITQASKKPKTQSAQEDTGNVLSLYPEAPDAPLIMQPQVWIATGIAAILVLFLAKRRRKRK